MNEVHIEPKSPLKPLKPPAFQLRQPYTPPQLIDHGSIERLTQADGGDVLDASDGSVLI